MFGAIASAFHQKWRVVGLSFGNQPFQNPTEVFSFVHLVQPLIDVIQRNKTILNLEVLDS